MKIIIIAPYLNSKGGVARYTWELSEFLASKGDSVILCSLFLNEKIYQKPENFKVINLADKNSLPQTVTFWMNLNKIRKKLFDLIKNEKPDLIMYNDFPTTLWVQKFNDIPSVCYMHDIHMLYTNTYINNLPALTRIFWRIIRIIVREKEKKRCKYFDHIICNSNFLASYISKHYKINSRVIYPGSNSKKFFPSGNKRMNVILTLGDIRLRRPDFLLDVANLLDTRHFEIWIVGNKNDNYEKELRNIISKHNLTNNVKFFGKVTDKKLAKLYSESLVVVHLVKEAPFGLIVTEAMACGTPVISWTPGGPAEIIEDGKSGYLIPENDKIALKEKLEIFLENPDLAIKFGNYAKKSINNKFTTEKNFLELRDFFIDLIK